MSDSGRALEEDLKWREAELASLKLLVVDAASGTVRQQVLLRALCTLLYAHYEGFCKFAWDYYLDSLEKTEALRKDCVDKIAKASLKKAFKEIQGDLSLEGIWDLCTSAFPSLMLGKLEFSVRLETKSNLSPSLLAENSSSIGLACAVVRTHEVKLRSLVARRNEIAHGRKMLISTLAEYQDYENAAVAAMHELAISVIEVLESKAYLSSNSGPAPD